MLNFDSHQKEFLNILLGANVPIQLALLQQQLNMSRRTIYYIVNKVNDELAYHNLMTVQNKRGQGYYLLDEQKAQIRKLLEQETTEFLKPKERVYYIICWLLYPQKIVYVETMMQQLDISRNSVFNALKQVKHELRHYDINLEFGIKKGYSINVKTFNRRAILLYYLKLLLHKVHYRNLHFLNTSEVEVFYNRLLKISSDMGNEYDNENLLSLACLLCIVHYVHEQFDFSLMELRDLSETDELQLIDEAFQDFNVHERLYLTIHLLGSKARDTLNVQDDENDIRLFELAQRIADAFERMTCIHLVDKNGLINSLYLHFKLSMYYHRLSIQIVNPLMNEVKANYSDLYQLVHMICNEKLDDFPFPVMDSEIVYITMHFGGHLRQGGGNFYRRIRVLVVCPSGISTSTLLKREIEDLYSNVMVVASTTANNIEEYEEDIDFIVSTVNIKSEIPWIKVNAILSNEDKSRIASLMMINFETYEIEGEHVNGLFDILRKYVPESQMKNMKYDVFQYLQQGNVIVKIEEQKQFRIFDVLKAEDIMLVNREYTWKDAIYEASNPLLKNNSIKEKYIQAMIELLEDYGPYIVLQNKVAIAHANPEKGANVIGLSLLMNEQDIIFEDNVKVRYLFVLSNPEQNKHLHLLRDIMLLSSNIKILEEIAVIHDASLILEKLKVFSNIMQYNE